MNGPLNTGPLKPVFPESYNPALSDSKGMLSDSKGVLQKVPDPMVHNSGASVEKVSHSALGHSGVRLFSPVSGISVPLQNSGVSVPLQHSGVSVPLQHSGVSVPLQHSGVSVPSAVSGPLQDSLNAPHSKLQNSGVSVPLSDSLNDSGAVIPRPGPSGEGPSGEQPSGDVEVKASKNRLRKRMRISLLNAFLSQKIFQEHPGESFEAVDANGNLIPPVKPHFVWHLRVLGLYVILALPYTIWLILETFFVAPGFSEYCNLGPENCELEWTLSMLLWLFVSMVVCVPLQVLGDQTKMNLRTVGYVFLRQGLPTLCLQLLMYNLLPIIFDKPKSQLVLIFAILVRSPNQFTGYDEAARSLLGYDDWWDFRKRNEDPDDPAELDPEIIIDEKSQKTGEKLKKGERLKRGVKVVRMFVLGNAMLGFWIILDLAFIANGTWGTLLQTLRPATFFALKRISYFCFVWCENNLEGREEKIGYAKQYVGPWVQITMGLGTSLTAMNCVDWQAFLFFWVCDMAAFGNRVFAFSDVGEGSSHEWIAKYRKSMLWGKPKAIGKMNQRELLGYDLIMEGVTLQVAYVMLLLV